MELEAGKPVGQIIEIDLKKSDLKKMSKWISKLYPVRLLLAAGGDGRVHLFFKKSGLACHGKAAEE